MKREKIDYLKRMYNVNPETGNYIIELNLDSYLEVFNEWDHSSYKRRDMAPDLANFLEECSEDIPLKYDIDISMYLPKESQDPEKEKIISNRIHSYYNFYAVTEKKSLKKQNREMINFIVIAFVLIFLNIIISSHIHSIITRGLTQGLVVGAWVFLWEPITFFTFERREISDIVRTYERLANANIYFKYLK
jgi:hypothetical protein